MQEFHFARVLRARAIIGKQVMSRTCVVRYSALPRMGRLPHFLSYGAPSTRALRARVELRYNLLIS